MRRRSPATRQSWRRRTRSCCRAWGRLAMRWPNCGGGSWCSRFSDAIAAGKPFLGICLGLQLLFDVGYEGGEFEGLGVLRGKVRAVRSAAAAQGAAHGLEPRHNSSGEPPLLEGIADGTFFYFVHSYYVVPEDARTGRDRGRLRPSVLCSRLARRICSPRSFIRKRARRMGCEF